MERAARARAAGGLAVRGAGAISGKDARTLARELLTMTQEELSRAFSKSPMKRAKLRGLKRNAAVVLGNVGTTDDVEVVTRALDDDDRLLRDHAVGVAAYRESLGHPLLT